MTVLFFFFSLVPKRKILNTSRIMLSRISWDAMYIHNHVVFPIIYKLNNLYLYIYIKFNELIVLERESINFFFLKFSKKFYEFISLVYLLIW